MKRNPVAKALRTPKFKKRIIKDKKKYNRKKKQKDFEIKFIYFVKIFYTRMVFENSLTKYQVYFLLHIFHLQ